jgi:hypothetical protein
MHFSALLENLPAAKLSGIILPSQKTKEYVAERTLLLLKKCVVVQVNDAAVRIKQVLFVSKVQLFYKLIPWGSAHTLKNLLRKLFSNRILSLTHIRQELK